jgi:arylsulfatase A-like enzyme
LGALTDFESTIVVYTSDHGDALGEHGLPFKGPFMYEEEIRIPLVIRAPWAFSGKREDLVTQADLAPTLASLVGLRWPKAVTGRDLSKGRLTRDAVFLEYYAKQKWINPIRTIRSRRWKLNWYNSGNQELYDLQTDPHETRNRVGDAAVAGIRKQLEDRLNAWRGPHP